jgi:FkbM family methyltransferase
MALKSFVNKVLKHAARKLDVMSHVGCDAGRIGCAIHLKRLGVAYSRYELFEKKWLLDEGIRTIIDVGANVGEFTTIFAELFPDARVYAFEPLPDCFEQLRKVAKQYQGRVKPFNIALSTQEGNFKFHRSNWPPASSFREMSDLHKKNYPHSIASETVKVDVKTLDKVFENIELKKNVFIKLDVQGFEDEVIKGGLEVINRAKVLVIECSLQQTYEGEPMFDGIYKLLRPMGFEYRGSLKQSVCKDDESFLQADCVFIRKL